MVESKKNHSKFVAKLTVHLNNEFQVFTCPGIAIILMLQEEAFSMFRLVSVDSNDNEDVSMQHIP